MTTTNFAHLGSVSHATMRHEDLIPCFTSLLEELHAQVHHKKPHGFDASTVGLIKEGEAYSEDMDNEEADELLSSLFDALDGYAPEGYYFGAHPGDGSDYGFWQCEEE